MSVTTRPGSCSRLSLAAGEELAGTTPAAGGYLVLEHGGPWGVKPFRDATFPGDDAGPALGPTLAAALAPLGVTPLLARRPGARHGAPTPATVLAVAVDAAGGRGARTAVTDLAELHSWDLPGLFTRLRAGAVPPGWEPLGTTYLVCTHARRDACCGELGRPVAAALTALAPEQTWEVSHLGGHRLAPNTLVLPEGVVYGRLAPGRAADLVAAHAAGRLLLAELRGRAGLPGPAQVAEVEVRRRTGRDAAGAVRVVDVAAAGGRTTAELDVDGRRWTAVVQTEPGAGGPRPTSCGADPGPPPERHVLVAAGPVSPSGG